MKIAFYMEDGLEQIVLSPQTKIEQEMLNKLHEGCRTLEVYRGQFYESRGGWMRHSQDVFMDNNHQYERSTIIVLREKKDEPHIEPVGEAFPRPVAGS